MHAARVGGMQNIRVRMGREPVGRIVRAVRHRAARVDVRSEEPRGDVPGDGGRGVAGEKRGENRGHSVARVAFGRDRRVTRAADGGGGGEEKRRKNAVDRRRRPRGDLVLAHASDALRARGVGTREVRRPRVLRSAHVFQGVSRAGDSAIHGRATPCRAVVYLHHGTAHLRVDVLEPRDAVLRRRARSARVHAERHGRVRERRARGRVRSADARDETVPPAEVEV